MKRFDKLNNCTAKSRSLSIFLWYFFPQPRLAGGVIPLPTAIDSGRNAIHAIRNENTAPIRYTAGRLQRIIHPVSS
jgi:hypothetical protein